MEQGLEQGMKKGIVSEKRNLAKNLIRLGMPLEQIFLVTGLEKEELNVLAKEIKN